MAATLSDRVNALFQREAWKDAEGILERALKKAPDDHWLLTQLGAALYEQRRYRDALRHLESSLAIVPDCPLTLWHLAGTLDALDRPTEAVDLYLRLVRSTVSPLDDPCWESVAWADSLKTDCVYRIGVCYQRLGHPWQAKNYFRTYLNLLSRGLSGTYPADVVSRRIRNLPTSDEDAASDVEWQSIVQPPAQLLRIHMV
jgi:tetratricopeptide (TPR) repeat protein